MYVGIYSPPTFLDIYRYTCPGAPSNSAGCSALDTETTRGILPSGTNDGATAATNDGEFTVIEMSHPLRSGDGLHDFSLKPGDTVGFHFNLRLFSLTPACNFGSTCYADTAYPSDSYYGQITIAGPAVPCPEAVGIDIKPGCSLNNINPESMGKIPVAILSTGSFNASTMVDVSSLTFGSIGDEQSLAFCSGPEDVNGDGLPDLVCHFYTEKAGFSEGDSEGILKGRTITGRDLIGRDSVRIVPDDDDRKHHDKRRVDHRERRP
jgi:hypothetical protein